jgi:hypothetical protein
VIRIIISTNSNFEAHKNDFGIKKYKFNTQHTVLYKQKLLGHINNPDTLVIAGTFRENQF